MCLVASEIKVCHYIICSMMCWRIKGATSATNSVLRKTVLHFPAVGKHEQFMPEEQSKCLKNI